MFLGLEGGDKSERRGGPREAGKGVARRCSGWLAERRGDQGGAPAFVLDSAGYVLLEWDGVDKRIKKER